MDTVNRPTVRPAAIVSHVGRPAGEPPSVLLVDDDDTLRGIVQRNLEVRGYRVDAVGTAEAAITAALREPPAVLLLDINLPDGSGWDVLRELREQGRRVPTIIVSAVRCSQLRLDEFRPDVYLPKPFPLNALLEAVKRLAPFATSASDATAKEMAEPHIGAPTERNGPRSAAGGTAWRVPRSRRIRGVTDAGERAYLARLAAASATRELRAHETQPPRPKPAAPRTLQEIMNGALCDVVADPASGIARASVAGATAAGAEQLHAAAELRGLLARSAVSPSLHVGWVTIERRDAHKGNVHAGSDSGYRLHRADNRFSRALAWLRGGLRALVTPVPLSND